MRRPEFFMRLSIFLSIISSKGPLGTRRVTGCPLSRMHQFKYAHIVGVMSLRYLTSEKKNNRLKNFIEKHKYLL